jgi:hypothetical protein
LDGSGEERPYVYLCTNAILLLQSINIGNIGATGQFQAATVCLNKLKRSLKSTRFKRIFRESFSVSFKDFFVSCGVSAEMPPLEQLKRN